MLISAPVRLRSFGIDCRFGGLNHRRELLAVLHCRPEPSLGLCGIFEYPKIHLVGLRRSLVSRWIPARALSSSDHQALRLFWSMIRSRSCRSNRSFLSRSTVGI